ncbi:uncharacterized protein A4U43_C01F28980 [Asparagus officinalis]|uniref:Endonuclease/exonuclease/phosphatase domain-containing protein n=1 Tax=Asparagus officinalis TaxID=4686 RepID=A0A5P1FT78_ASPOF|nr:uncharacterized protein A4U43_C01F28840 [Asparagus officinalis]ONK81428.1 uncharacterized protein A4U43_C01F28980 [Asparagus officinalis]
MSRFHIDIEVSIAGYPKWRLTGYYGNPDRNRRRESWDQLRLLATSSHLPWVCIGDFNDLLYQHEKMGLHKHPSWLLNGFKEAIDDYNLCDLGLVGHQFTWFKSKGTPNWVEERLDRAFASPSWTDIFPSAYVHNLGHFHLIMHLSS